MLNIHPYAKYTAEKKNSVASYYRKFFICSRLRDRCYRWSSQSCHFMNGFSSACLSRRNKTLVMPSFRTYFDVTIVTNEHCHFNQNQPGSSTTQYPNEQKYGVTSKCSLHLIHGPRFRHLQQSNRTLLIRRIGHPYGFGLSVWTVISYYHSLVITVLFQFFVSIFTNHRTITLLTICPCTGASGIYGPTNYFYFFISFIYQKQFPKGPLINVWNLRPKL